MAAVGEEMVEAAADRVTAALPVDVEADALRDEVAAVVDGVDGPGNPNWREERSA